MFGQLALVPTRRRGSAACRRRSSSPGAVVLGADGRIRAGRRDDGRRTADEEQRRERCGEDGPADAAEPVRRSALPAPAARAAPAGPASGSRHERLVMPFHGPPWSCGLGGRRSSSVTQPWAPPGPWARASIGSRAGCLEYRPRSIVATRSERDVRAGRGATAGSRRGGSPPSRSRRGSRLGTRPIRRVSTSPAAAASRSHDAVAERVRHPRIAAIGVVLDDDEPAARPEVRGEAADDRDLPVARRRSGGCWRRRDRRARGVSSGPVRSATSVVRSRRREARPDGRRVRARARARRDRPRRSARPDRAGRRGPA